MVSHDDSTEVDTGDVTVPAIVTLYSRLQSRCSEILKQTFEISENVEYQGRSHELLNEVGLWATAMCEWPEARLLEAVGRELQYALLSVAQGQYRDAFRGLRLVIELTLQIVHLSANLIDRQEWIAGTADTVWSRLVDDQTGVLSARYTRAFFPDLEYSVATYREMARKLYRECSECVHGNLSNRLLVPEGLEFSQASFTLWHQKVETAALVLHFSLAARFCHALAPRSVARLEVVLRDRLGHMPAIREFFDRLGGH